MKRQSVLKVNSVPKIVTIILFVFFILHGQSYWAFASQDPDQLRRQLKDSRNRERMELLVKLTSTYCDREPAQALMYGKEALEMMSTGQYDQFKFQHYYAIGAANIFYGRFSEADDYSSKLLKMAQQKNNKPELAQAYYLEALKLIFIGKIAQVLTPLTKSLDLYIEIGDDPNKSKCYNLLGLLYWRL